MERAGILWLSRDPSFFGSAGSWAVSLGQVVERAWPRARWLRWMIAFAPVESR